MPIDPKLCPSSLLLLIQVISFMKCLLVAKGNGLLRWDWSAIFLIFKISLLLSYFHSFCRREMMPLLSLIFSALFILFGTVVIQAFR